MGFLTILGIVLLCVVLLLGFAVGLAGMVLGFAIFLDDEYGRGCSMGLMGLVVVVLMVAVSAHLAINVLPG